jgi:hypothetical protein
MNAGYARYPIWTSESQCALANMQLRTVGPTQQVTQSSYLALKIARVIKALDGCETSIDGSKPLENAQHQEARTISA